jgi:hypothetical protein
MKHRITSNIWRDRLVSEAIGRPDDIRSRRLQMQRVAAGSPKVAAIIYLDVISHQMGRELFTFPAQTIKSTELITDVPNNHNVKAIVAILHTRICRGRGMSTSMAAIKPSGGRAGYSMDANRSAGEGGEEGEDLTLTRPLEYLND